MTLHKLLFTLLAPVIFMPLMGTSDSPSSSSSSTLTVNMSDATESKRTKRRAVEVAVALEADLESSPKAVRISPNLSVLAMADEPSEEASSSPSIAHESSLAVGLIAPVPPAKQAGNIPVWFCCHPLFKTTFEHLNFADLTQARRVSKFFHAMAPQVVMPQGQQWINWCVKKFDQAKKNVPAQRRAMRDVIEATGRCPNAMANLRNIVAGYYEQVPEELRFWDLGPRNKPSVIAAKENLRLELGTILEQIKKLEKQHQKDQYGVTKQLQQSTVPQDLAALKLQQEKELAPLKAQKQKLLDGLLPSLHAIFPYAVANTILSELDTKLGLPEQLPLVTKDYWCLGDDIAVLAKKATLIRRLPACLAAACMPAVHDSLFAQTNNIICLDKSRRVAQHNIEKRFRDKVEVHEFDPTLSFTTDLVDIMYFQIKVEQLRQTQKNVILKNRSIQRNVVELALGTIESAFFEFIRVRVEKYYAALRKVEKNKQLAILTHITKLINVALGMVPDTELDLCRCLVTAVAGPWLELLNPKQFARAAYFAEKAVARAGNSLKPSDLRTAVTIHLKAKAYQKAAQYLDQLCVEFESDTYVMDYILASKAWASSSVSEADVSRHFNVAMERLDGALKLVPDAFFSDLKASAKEIEITLHTKPKSQLMATYATKLKECHAAISARLILLLRSGNPAESNADPGNSAQNNANDNQ